MLCRFVFELAYLDMYILLFYMVFLLLLWLCVDAALYFRSSTVGVPKEKRRVSSLDQFISVDRLTGTGQEQTRARPGDETSSANAPKLEFQRVLESRPVLMEREEEQVHSIDGSEDQPGDHRDVEQEEERPSMDIFRAIFVESEESESSEDEGQDIPVDEEQKPDEDMQVCSVKPILGCNQCRTVWVWDHVW